MYIVSVLIISGNRCKPLHIDVVSAKKTAWFPQKPIMPTTYSSKNNNSPKDLFMLIFLYVQRCMA